MRAKILRELARGHHAVSEPVPPQREWARKLGVSSFTVQRAFDALKREGIVDSREGSYTFLRRLPERIPAEQEVPGPKPRTRLCLWLGEPKDLRWMRRSLFRQQFARKFLAENPQVKLDEHLFDLTPGVLEARILSHMLHGPEPMVAQVRRTCLSPLTEHDSLAPFEDSPGSEPYLPRINPRWLEVCRTNGQVHFLPTSVSCSFFFYNKSLFQKAGLDPARPPRDWEELLATARTLKDARGGQPSLHLLDDRFFVWWLLQLAYQAMPRETLAVKGGGATPLPCVDWLGGAARQAIEFFLKLRFREKVLHLSHENVLVASSRCVKDEIPMMMGDARLAVLVAQLNQGEKFGIAPLPAGPNGLTISMLNCIGWVLNAHASPEEQRVAGRFAVTRERFIHSDRGGAEMKALGVCPSLLPILKAGCADTFLATPLPREWTAALEELVAVGRWEPEDADWKKEILANAAPPFLAEDAVPDAQHLQHSLALAEAGHGTEDLLTSTLP